MTCNVHYEHCPILNFNKQSFIRSWIICLVRLCIRIWLNAIVEIINKLDSLYKSSNFNGLKATPCFCKQCGQLNHFSDTYIFTSSPGIHSTCPVVALWYSVDDNNELFVWITSLALGLARKSIANLLFSSLIPIWATSWENLSSGVSTK